MPAEVPSAESSLYCAFIDILGFSAIISEWDRAKAYYDVVMAGVIRGAAHYVDVHVKTVAGAAHDIDKMTRWHQRPSMSQDPRLRWRIISDSIIATSANPWTALMFASEVQSLCLGFSFLTRGGLAYGRHLEYEESGNFLVVSEALRDAYHVETSLARTPRVALHESALAAALDLLTDEITDFRGTTRVANPTARGIVIQGDDGLWFANPFAFGPVMSTEYRTQQLTKLLSETPEVHRSKVLWVADLHNYYEMRGFISTHYDVYADAPAEFLQLLRQAAERDNLATELVPTWTFTASVNRFYTALVGDGVPPVKHPYNQSFTENVRSQRIRLGK